MNRTDRISARGERCWEAFTSPAKVLAAVEARLVAAGAVVELRQFYGLSAQEQDVLLRLERDGCPSGCPQDARRTMAA